MTVLEMGFAERSTFPANLLMGAPVLQNWLFPHGEGSLSSNVGAADLAYQRWFRFKEAYSPRLVMEALQENSRPVGRCIDPTGGSGTTALVCSFLGIDCDTVEVNPFMADLIAAKTRRYDTGALSADIAAVLGGRPKDGGLARYAHAPSTLIEPGDGGRWVFNAPVAAQIGAFADAIDLAREEHRPFLRVMLGSVLRDVSNVVVNGKGRKYRRGWDKRVVTGGHVVDAMRGACNAGYSDIVRFSNRLQGDVRVHHGDARVETADLPEADCAIFSPPYPNSFDYTDIYNLELWMLGYLRSGQDNRKLRLATMHSHVQLNREGREPAGSSPEFLRALEAVEESRSQLWHRGIPSMLRSYFADMEGIIADLAERIRPGGLITVIVGGSSYAGIGVDAPKIIAELGQDMGLDLVRHSPLRAMRLSAQQGGQFGLSEDAVVFAC
ncbi:hypothetical protein [Sphingomonas sp. PR090111-T3T-6A]|uniref:hypothetical protein n=1 Tax=Sphingomonas sp. PR090111-T3T-6A TaxID=685778 RepID=UPI0012FA9BA5|nr:hypothetical protein [Sphingomonas sp. PR090111-T3T-6A]